MHNTEKKWIPVDTMDVVKEELNFADNLALLSLSHLQRQAAIFSRVGLDVRKGKTKVLKVHAARTGSVTLEGNEIGEVHVPG